MQPLYHNYFHICLTFSKYAIVINMMTAKNEHTNDPIRSKPTTDHYRDNPIWDKWEKKKKDMRESEDINWPDGVEDAGG